MSMNNLVRVQEEFLGKTHCQGHHDLSLGTAQRMSVKMVPIYVVSQSHSSCRTRSRAPLRMASGAGPGPPCDHLGGAGAFGGISRSLEELQRPKLPAN